jgi:enterobacteria phage integrase
LAKRQLPPNLYERRGYYSWRNPKTREEYGIGTNRGSAIAQAVEANLKLCNELQRTRLIHRMDGSEGRNVVAWSERYAAYLASRDFADATRRQYSSFNRRIVDMLGADTLVKAVTALQISEGLAKIVAEGKARTAQCFRVFARDWFREAIVQGWRDDNPVRDTKIAVKVMVKRARLLFPVFMQVYEAEKLPWARNAYALLLVSAQRREDACGAKFTAFKNGGWWLKQASEKSDEPHRIFIPLTLRLEAFGMSLQDVVSQCRRTDVASPYLVHHCRSNGKTKRGAPVWRDTLSKQFSKTLATLGLDFGDKEPPTLHEIRSLSERLYADQGGVATQHLLGHNEPETTAVYHDSRGSEWVHALDGRKIVSE